MNETRRTVLLRDNLSCVACGLTVAVEDGDHIRPIHQYSLQHRKARGMGGTGLKDHPENLIVMCGTGTTGCHGRAEQNPGWAITCGYRVSQWADVGMAPVKVITDPIEPASWWLLNGDTRHLTELTEETT